MAIISISFNDNLTQINNILNERLCSVEREYNIGKEMKEYGNILFLKYNLNEDKNHKYKNINNLFKHCVANILSDIILDLYQEKMIENTVEEKYYYLDSDEKKQIIDNALKILKNKSNIFYEDIEYRVSQKSRIMKVLLEYLENNDEINVEGFVNFRLKFLKNYVYSALDSAMEEFIADREYREFIKILQYFVEMQEPKYFVVNVFLKEDGKYQLFDEKMKKINSDAFEEITQDIIEYNMDYDDLLISSLITMAPEKIVMHWDSENSKNSNVINIIKGIFKDKILECNGCPYCNAIIHKNHRK